MIELTKPKYGTRCNDCFSDEDVKEINLHGNGQGVVIRLCTKCRGELIRLLLNDNKKMTERERWLKEHEEDKEICKNCERDCSMCGIRNKDCEGW